MIIFVKISKFGLSSKFFKQLAGLMTTTHISEERYNAEIAELFRRFPSVQNVPFANAYKPGLERMREFALELGNPQNDYRIIHVAGTNGKGSVSSMLASSLAALGMETGLFTSPHIRDFRERMKMVGSGGCRMPDKAWVYDFIVTYRKVFEGLSLSFFEITTGMAMKWFSECGASAVMLEVGLGGRLDSTNIVTPDLSVITSIGLDHCDLLGDTLEKIAGEKAGIIKRGVPVVIGEALPQTRPVFEHAASENCAPVHFAEDSQPWLWNSRGRILEAMDLQGSCQEKNLRTVLTALPLFVGNPDADKTADALVHTAQRTDFHGRWEMLCRKPLTICDIGHNAHALRGNFAQLEAMHRPMVIVYAVMADKDLDAILPLMPRAARYIFTTPSTARALPASRVMERYLSAGGDRSACEVCDSVPLAVDRAFSLAAAQESGDAVIYIGGSTFAVSEAVPLFRGGRYEGAAGR